MTAGKASIRLIDAGTVPPLRSQTIYHGLAYAREETTPDTIVLATPAEPYVCVGFHQDIAHEIDADFCQAQGLLVLRRETGGGAVYLDSDQLFVQWVMGEGSLPTRIDRRFELFSRPLVSTYQQFGIDAQFRPVNDVHIEGRKIAGTGAARIGNAEVLVGNFIFDFDTAVMTKVLRAPSESFRDQVDRSLSKYMTSMSRELDAVPQRSEVSHAYIGECEKALQRELEVGELTAPEIEAIEEVERRFLSAGFLTRPGGLRRPGVKIHEDVHVVERVHDVDGGSIRVTARLREGRIEDVSLVGDTRTGLRRALELEALLQGVELRPEPITSAVQTYQEHQRVTPDLEANAWVQAILSLHSQPKDLNHDRRP